MRQEVWLCDRCGAKLSQGAGYGVGLTVEYHHPHKLEICPSCEDEFTLWLGKQPMTGTTLQQQSVGACYGGGYPDQERVVEYLRNPVAKRGDHA